MTLITSKRSQNISVDINSL